MNKKVFAIVINALLIALIVAACQGQSAPAPQPTDTPAPAPTTPSEPTPTEAPSITPAVQVEDQKLMDGKVAIARVTAPQDGWIVIHAQKDGKPGPILGFAPVKAGNNENVLVEIDPAMASPTVYAMLHVDAGESGKFEFPNGPDAPVKADGKVVVVPFNLTQ